MRQESRFKTRSYLKFALSLGTCLVLLGLSASAYARGSIRFFPKSEVSASRVTLADVARVQGIADPELRALILNADLGAAPLPGKKKTLSKPLVLSVLRHVGVGKGIRVVFPKKVTLTRPGQTLSPAKVEHLIHKALKAFVDNVETGKGTSSVHRPSWRRRLVLPAGELQIKPSVRPGVELLGLVTFRLEFHVDGHVALKRSISARIDVSGEFCQAARNIARGEIISINDVSLVHGPLEKGALACEEVVGMTPRSSFRAGKTFRMVSLKPPLVVKRGQHVMIVYESGPLRVTSTGEARRDGAVGQWIPVRNSSSGTEIKARVVSPGRVNVY